MYIVNKKDERYYALGKDEKLIEFTDYAKLLRWLYQKFVIPTNNTWVIKPKILKEIGHNFNDTYVPYTIEESQNKTIEYIIYDAYFRVVPKYLLLKDIEAFVNDAYNNRNRYFRKRQTDKTYSGYRRDPIPLTGKSNWKFRCFYKTSINVVQEYKALYIAKENCVNVRGKRNKNRLPNVWDDIRRGDSWNKYSWKKLKKQKQWM